MDIHDSLAILFFIVMSGGPFVVVFVFWEFYARKKGLVKRVSDFKLADIDQDVISIVKEKSVIRVPLSSIKKCRLAFNDNWTESKSLGDALTIYGAKTKLIVKIPCSIKGFEAVTSAIESAGIEIERVAVSAPAYLD